MPLILTSRTPWRRRPSGLVEIDRSSPQASELVALFVPIGTGFRDLVSGKYSTWPFGQSSANDLGVAVQGVNSSSETMSFSGIDYGATFTVAAWFRKNDTATANAIGVSGKTSGSGFQWIGYSSSSNVRYLVRTAAGTTVGDLNYTDSASGVGRHLVGTCNDKTLTLTLNGQTVNSSTGATSADSFDGSALGIGAWAGATRQAATYNEIRWYRRALSAAEVWHLYAPDTRWSLYAPLVVRRYFDLGGAGGPSDLVCDAGAYTVTGFDASLTRARLLTCDAGSYSLTGQDASITRARVLTADAGSYSYTGQDATLTRARVLTTEAGAYTLSGQEATLTAARAITLDAGSYSLTGHDATLTKGVALVADAGNYTVTGHDATLTWARALSVDAGSYTLTGNDASLAKLSAGTLDCDAGAYALTGYDATLTWARVLPLDAGGYAVTGQDVTFTAGAALVCDAGSYGVTGYDVDLWWAHVLSADAGAYSLTGQAATVSYSGEVVQVADAERTWQAAPRDTTWRAKVRDTTWRGRRR